MIVSPAQAADWLRHAHQRDLDGLKIRIFAQLMDRGEWTGHGSDWIVRDGRLLDGNHRAYAILLHGKPQDMPVIFQ